MSATIQELQQAVNKIIFENSSYILSEIAILETSEKFCHLVEEIVKETYCEDCDEASENNSTSFIVAHSKLLDIVKHRPNSSQFPLFLTPEEREHAKSTFTFVKSFMNWRFNYGEFYKALCAGPYLPLELLWSLHERGIMSFEMFFTSILDKPKSVAAFSRSIVHLFCMEVPLETASCNVTSGILAYVVTSAFPNTDVKETETVQETGINKVSHIILDCTIKRIITCERMKSEGTRMLAFNLLWENSSVVQSSLHTFCCYSLKFILSYNPNVRVSQALSEQQNWTFRNANSDFVSFIQKILLKLEPQEVSSTLHRALDAHEVNWKSLLIATSTYLVCFKEASSYLLEIIHKLLNEAFTKLECDHLFSGFLLARQATLEGPPLFPVTYGDWFQKTFGDASSTHANNPRTFGFLMKFLTDLVPHEHIQYLKVHIERPPYIVNRCKSIFTDYSSLVKTRLRDLAPNCSTGLFSSAESDVCSSKHANKTQLVAEIEKVLQSFEATGKIPSAVLQASIFQKSYFSGQFLPVLLSSRLLPDVPDTKMKFIDILKRSGKIPPALFEKYEKACRKEAEKLFEGITLDDSFEEGFLSPEEQLQEVLKNLQLQLGICKMSSNGSQPLLAVLTENCEKLENVLKQLDHTDSKMDTVIMISENIPRPTEREEYGCKCVSGPGNIYDIREIRVLPPEMPMEVTGIDVQVHLHISNADYAGIHVLNLSLNIPFLKYAAALWQYNETVCYRKMMEKILDAYCSLQQTLKDADHSVILAWDPISVLTHFPSLHSALYHTIQEKLLNNNKSFEEHELKGLSLCLLRIGVMHFQYPPAIWSASVPEPVLFPELIFGHLPVTSGLEIWYFLRLAASYLEQATWCADNIDCDNSNSVVPNYIPAILLKKFQFTAFRLVPQVINCDAPSLQNDGLEDVVKLYKSSTVKQWINAHQLTLKEWLTYESDVVAEADHFDSQKRSDFLRWCLNCHYTAYPELVHADAQSVYRGCASSLFRILMSMSHSKSSYQQLLMILQEFVSSLSCGSVVSSSNSSSWLLQEFDVALEACNKDKKFTDKMNVQNQVLVQDIVRKFVRIACSLPPVLLVVDSPYEAHINPDFKALENFVNNFLRLYACENGFLAPILLCHILKALLEIFQASSNEHIIENFLLGCPLVLSSLIIHWKFVQPIILNFRTKRKNYLRQILSEIGAFFSWSESFILKKEPPSFPVRTTLPEWAPGLIFASRLLNSENFILPFHLLNYQLFVWSLRFVVVLETIRSETTQCRDVYPSSCAISFVKAFITLHKNGDGIDPRIYGQSAMKKALPPGDWQSFPAGILRTLMAAFPKDEITHMNEDLLLPLLSSLLMNLTECSKCCDDSDSPSSVDTSDRKIHKVQNKVLTMEFLLDSTQKVKEFISAVSPTIIKAVPHAVVQYCGEDMQLFLYQKVGKKTRFE